MTLLRLPDCLKVHSTDSPSKVSRLSKNRTDLETGSLNHRKLLD